MPGVIRTRIHAPSRDMKVKLFTPKYILKGHPACQQETIIAELILHRVRAQEMHAGHQQL
jgi:hypothetical protein